MRFPSCLTVAAAATALLPLLAAALPVSEPARELKKRTTTLADGSSMQTGTLSSTVKWQSSGVLLQGCDVNVGISDCYTLQLAATGNLQRRDLEKRSVSRQRIEFYSSDYSAAGETWHYSWKYYLVPGVASSDHFFHLSQLLSREFSNPVYALDLYKSTVAIEDLYDTSRCSSGICKSILQESFWGRTTYHSVTVTFGDYGSYAYTITDALTGAILLSYSTSGVTVPASASLKTGIYRAVVEGATSSTAYVGDLRFVKMA